jgi:predicted nucleotidyltransferase
MTASAQPGQALIDIAGALAAAGRDFALVGGLAVSVRAEVRFTQDVDIAVAVDSDDDAERLVFDLGRAGYSPIASVEHETQKRLATIRLASPSGITVDLMLASCGIEREVIDRAPVVPLPGVGSIRIARAEELLAMKVLSMTERRLQDRLDALNLVLFNPGLRLDDVRDSLALITERGFDRGQDLAAKLDEVLRLGAQV